jgi:transposase
MEVPTMAQVMSFGALDVHVSGTVAASIEFVSGELRVQRLAGGVAPALEWCRALPGPVRVTYEAGPTGFGLARALAAEGIDCLVCAPGLIPRAPRDRVKTDRRDAERLVRLLMAGELSAVRVPTLAEEGLRDLVRAREDVRMDLTRARHRLGKQLLRHDVRFDGPGQNWTQRHLDWLTRVELPDGAAHAAFTDYLDAVRSLMIRRERLEREITALVPVSPWVRDVALLRCLRGIDTLSAIGLCVEVGDFSRFERPGKLMSFLGLVPSENSSGEKRRQGAITKAGSGHARRLLVEAAWHYRRPPRRGTTLLRRQDGQPEHICQISWSAQQRLHRTWRRLDHERGKRRTIAAVAVARELAGFCWAITTAD